MFGPDTDLMFGAMQMAGIVAAITGGAVFLVMRRSKAKKTNEPTEKLSKGDLEERVRVLERIATDRSADLADEIEALRAKDQRSTKQLEGSDQ